MKHITESTVEAAVLAWFDALGYATAFGPDLAPEGPAQERDSFEQVYLMGRLRAAIRRINPGINDAAIESAINRLTRAESQNQVAENQRVHNLLVSGVPVEQRDADGGLRTAPVWLIDWDAPANNDWLAVDQVTVVANHHNRRPDVLVYVNGLPLALFELKNPGDENATLRKAWQQIQTYRDEIGPVFTTNAVTVISDGTSASMSSFSGAFEHYAPWKTIDGSPVVTGLPALEVLVRGVFDKARFLDLVRHFIVFSEETALIKRVAKYHQYWAVNAAVDSTVKAAGPAGDRRGGVVWHTQGSGKSFEMVFYAGKIMRDPRMGNPTLVFITDRNDLDNQLFTEVFAPASVLPERPVQAGSRANLRELLRRASGGIIFTTLQKFAPIEDAPDDPVLTDRRNVVVVADEAHRSQYGFGETLDKQGHIRAGLAKYLRDALPGATYLGFTGTPIESADKSTRSVFGDYIDVYDLTRAVDDGATVPIYYESRLAKVHLTPAELATLDQAADEITSEADEQQAAKTKSRWSRLEAIVGAEDRLDLIARDIVDHWAKRRQAMLGKAMIVTMSRRIAVRLYEKLVQLNPDWHSDDPAQGAIKVIMTGSATDPPNYQPHIHSREDRERIKARMKNPDDPLQMVIVRDMWLTGFDSPSLNTMYVDKPMQGAGLMQAIARVNRTFRDKPGGLIVDYIGLFANLKQALATYSPSDQEQAGVPIEQIVNVMLEKHDIVRGLLHGCRYDSSPNLPATQLLAQHAAVMEFVMANAQLTEHFNDNVLALAKAYALAGASSEAAEIRDDVRLFTDVRTAILKIQAPDSGHGGSGAVEIDTAISQLVNEAISASDVVDIYKLAGVETPELSLLSDEFLDTLDQKPQPNLQLALLRKLINDEIRTVSRTNIVQSRKFSEQLQQAVNAYTNRSLSTAQVIAELVELAKQMRDDKARAERLGLSEAEIALYDAIVQNDAAVLQMGDDTLKRIAVDLVHTVRASVTIDWNLKESVRAKMRADIKKLLAKYHYPPDKEAKAVELVLQQAELIAADGFTGSGQGVSLHLPGASSPR